MCWLLFAKTLFCVFNSKAKRSVKYPSVFTTSSGAFLLCTRAALNLSCCICVWITVNFWLIQTGDLTLTICFSKRFLYRVVLFEHEFVHIGWVFVVPPLLLHGCYNSIMSLRVNAKGLRQTFSLSQFGIAFVRNGFFAVFFWFDNIFPFHSNMDTETKRDDAVQK